MLLNKSLPKIIESITPSIGAFGYAFQKNPNQFEISMKGTTFCIKDGGYFLTCKHVFDKIPDYAKKSIKIWLFDKKAERIKNYPSFDVDFVTEDIEFDFAIFKIKNCALPLTPLDLGDSDDVTVGQDVIFSGFPAITMGSSAKAGISITFATRKCIVSSIKKRNKDGSTFYFLFDTESNEGFSGSPFISLETKKVIGIVARRFRQLSQKADDIDKPAIFGWAYPINPVKRILGDI